jgi:hypothetical protein
MRREADDDEGPRRFIRSWLRFDEARPVRTRMLRNFAMLAATLLAASGLLVLVSSVLRR